MVSFCGSGSTVRNADAKFKQTFLARSVFSEKTFSMRSMSFFGVSSREIVINP